jgi:hypothetical protein
MIPAFDTASMSPRSSTDRAWPMTQAAWHELDAERQRLARDARGFGPGNGDGGPDGNVIQLPVRDAAMRLDRLAAVLDNAEIVDDPRVVAIGRRVTLREDDGTTVTYAVVAPGEGDPFEGWVSADSPIGMALLRSRVGATVEVRAPAGPRSVRIEGIR